VAVREERRKTEIWQAVGGGHQAGAPAFPETSHFVLIATEVILVTANLRVPASPCRGFDGRFAVAVGPCLA
jgi:hypothetical protein